MSIKVAMIPGSVSRLAGGLYTSVRRVSENLVERDGVQVQVVGNRDKNTDQDLKAWKTPPAILESSGLRSLSNELFHWLQTTDPDIAHTQFLWSYGSWGTTRWRKRNPHKKHIISPRGMLDPWAVKNSRWKKQIASFIFESAHLNSAACIHALCESEAKSIRSYGLKNPICVIPNGIDLPNLPSDFEARKKQSSGRKQMLFIGRIHGKKGLLPLLEAWALASQQLADWELVIAGWDDKGHLGEVQATVNRLGLQERVSLPGPLLGDEKRAALLKASAFVLPSYSEGLPMSVLEAWAYQLPVIMTQECNLPVGFTSQSAIEINHDPKTMAAQLSDFCALSCSELETIGLRGRQLVESDFQWSTIAAQLTGVYQWVLGTGGQPACVQD